MKTREEQIEFIKLNQVAVAACAWTGFRAKGRGLVYVLCDQHDEGTGTVPFGFTPEKDVSKMNPLVWDAGSANGGRIRPPN